MWRFGDWFQNKKCHFRYSLWGRNVQASHFLNHFSLTRLSWHVYTKFQAFSIMCLTILWYTSWFWFWGKRGNSPVPPNQKVSRCNKEQSSRILGRKWERILAWILRHFSHFYRTDSACHNGLPPLHLVTEPIYNRSTHNNCHADTIHTACLHTHSQVSPNVLKRPLYTPTAPCVLQKEGQLGGWIDGEKNQLFKSSN